MTLPRPTLAILVAVAAVAAEHDIFTVLARFGDIVTDNAARLSNYTCTETIERRYYVANLSKPARDCDDVAGAKKKPGYKLTLDKSDRLRLEVHTLPTQELYAWPGAPRFEDRELWDVVGDGPLASGPFSMTLKQVVQGDATDFMFEKEVPSGRRKLFQYTFRVPEQRSHYSIYQGDRWVAIPWSGTLQIDPETSDPVHLTTVTSELPPGAFACSIATDADYGRVAVDKGQYLVARETHQRFIPRTGDEVESTVTFSACREFRAESAVTFGEHGPAPSADKPAAPPAKPLNLPEGLPVVIALLKPIDSATAYAGDTFTGRLEEPVEDRSGRRYLPAGAIVHGRLVRMASRVRPPEVGILLKVETVEMDGVAVPFPVTGFDPGGKSTWLVDHLKNGVGIGGVGLRGGFGVWVERHPAVQDAGVEPLTFPGTSKVVEAGFKTHWVTTRPSE